MFTAFTTLPEEQKSQHHYWEGQELFRNSSEEMFPFPSKSQAKCFELCETSKELK